MATIATNGTEGAQGTSVVLHALASPEWDVRFSKALPAGVSKERFISTTVSAVRNFKGAANVDRESLYNAVLAAAQRGLMPDGREGALVEFNVKDGDRYRKVARFMPMVEGIIKEMAKAGIAAYAVSVCEKDEVRIWNDDAGQHVEHHPVVFGERGNRVGALAVGRVIGSGMTYVEVMTSAELDKVRAVSRSKDREGNIVGPWREWPDRMEQKSVLHRLSKRVPNAPDVAVEDEFIENEREAIEAEPAPTPASGKKRPRGLQAVVDQVRQEPISDEEPAYEAPTGVGPVDREEVF